MAEYTDAGIAEAIAASEKTLRSETNAAIKDAPLVTALDPVDEVALTARITAAVLIDLEASGKLSGGEAVALPANLLTYSYDGTEILIPFYERNSDPTAKPVLIGHDVIALNHGNKSFKRRFRKAD